MFLYIFFFLLFSLVLLYRFTNAGSLFPLKSVYSILVITFFCLSFLRWERGADWESYYNFFIQVNHPNIALSLDMGYQYLSCFISNVFGNYTTLLFIQGAILAYCFYVIIWKYSVDPLLSLLVFFSILFSGIYFVRQDVATALTFFSFFYIQKRRFIPFILTVILASFLHISALIFLLAYPLYNIYIPGKKIILYLIIACIGSLGISMLLTSVSSYLGPFIANKIDAYMMTGDDPTATGARGGMTLQLMLLKGLLSRSFVIIIGLFLLKNIRSKDLLINSIFNYYVFGTILYCVFAPVSIILARIVIYYEIFLVLLLANYIVIPKRIGNQFVVICVLSGYLFVRFLSNYSQYPERFAPFKSIFEI